MLNKNNEPDICVICEQKFNKTNKRLIRESCGHKKCLKCLLEELNGCNQCHQQTILNASQKSNSDTNILQGNSPCKIKTEWAKLSSEKESRKLCEEENCRIITTTSEEKVQKKSKKKNSPPSHVILKINEIGQYYECIKCSKTFMSRSNRQYHLFCGSKEKPFKCDKCAKSFITKFHFNYHQETHKIKKKYKCIQCEKEFIRKTSLRKHTLKHTQDFRFICSECGLKFQSKSLMKIHENKHANIYPHNCRECNRGFTLKANLKNHEIMHNGVKKFTCDKCDKKFPRKNALRLHMLTHSKFRTFFCKHCSKSFADKRIFERHQNIHSDNKKYNCPMCETKCTRKDNFRRHLRNIHPDENITNIIKEAEKSFNLDKDLDNFDNILENKIDESITSFQDGPNSVNVIQFVGHVNTMNIPIETRRDNGKTTLTPEQELEPEVISSIPSLTFKHDNLEINRIDPKINIGPMSQHRSYSNIEIYRRILSPYSILYEPVDTNYNEGTLKQPFSVYQENSKDQLTNNQTEKHFFISPFSANKGKSKKAFNPIDIYRKILIPSSNDDDCSINIPNTNEIPESQTSSERFMIKEQNRVPKDFTEIHWRKRTLNGQSKLS